MMTMREKIAEAIYERGAVNHRAAGATWLGAWADEDDDMKAEFLADADAVLAAMREPTEEMIEAAAETPGMKAINACMGTHQARGYGFAPGAFDAGSPLHQAWRAMLDAA